MVKLYCILVFLLLVQISSAQQTVGLFLNNSTSLNGYTLFTHGNSKVTYLIDNCGVKVYEWNSNFKPAAAVYLLDNGNLLRTNQFQKAYINSLSNFHDLKPLNIY